MRIVYLHQYFNTLKMSGGTRSYEMARRLVTKGHEVHMITSWREPTENRNWFTTQEDGIQVHWLPIPYSNHMSYRARIGAFIRFATASARRAAVIDADLIFATSTPLTIALPAVHASKHQNRPMVFEVRDLWPELPIAMGALKNPLLRYAAHRLEKWAYQKSEAVIALSPGMRDGIVKTGYPMSRVATIPNSSDNVYFNQSVAARDEFRTQRPWLEKRPLLIYAGTYGRINGVGYMVDLAKRLRQTSPEIRILLVGSGYEESSIRSAAEAAGIFNVNFFMESPMPKHQIPSLLAAADMSACLFIDLPEMRANSSNKFFDSLAASTPVMVNYGGWMADIIQSSNAGLVTWRQPIDLAADTIASALTDPLWLSAAGAAAKHLATSVFDRDLLANQFESVLNAAASRNGSKAYSLSPGEYAL